MSTDEMSAKAAACVRLVSVPARIREPLRRSLSDLLEGDAAETLIASWSNVRRAPSLLTAGGVRGFRMHTRSPEESAATIRAVIASLTDSRHILPRHLARAQKGARSRREEYMVVPAIRRSSCVYGRGCRECISACPKGAVRTRRIRDTGREIVEIDRAACVSCGVCMDVCAHSAIVHPTEGSGVRGTRIRTILKDAPGTWLAFTPDCVDEAYTLPAGVVQVPVACCGHISAAPIMDAVRWGAGGCIVVRGRCINGVPASRISNEVRFARDAVRGSGADIRVVALRAGTDLEPRAEKAVRRGKRRTYRPDRDESTTPDVRGGLLALAEWSGAGDIRIDSRGHGARVEITDACSTCLLCVRACPHGALTSEDRGEGVAILFSHVRCTGCGRCVPACPERRRGAIRLHNHLDTGLMKGAVEVWMDSMLRCERCGAPLAPRHLVERVRTRLQAREVERVDYVGRLCGRCTLLPGART